MWTVLEERDAVKAIDKLQPQVLRTFHAWRAIVIQQGPAGLRNIKAFHDEKLAGRLSHLRSSRLSRQWRVIYSVDADTVTVTVERVTAHDC
jgi:proteic killer suppression protein